MAIARVTNHIDQGLARLISRFKNRPRFAAWCASHIRQAQLFEDACWELVDALDVDTADLPRLTLLGKIVGQPPKGTLEQFRSYVKVRILVNRSNARAPALIKIATILLGPVTFQRWGAAITIDADAGTGGFDAPYVVYLLKLAKGAGVKLHLQWAEVDATSAFEFAPGSTHVFDGRGFADSGLTLGGTISRIL